MPPTLAQLPIGHRAVIVTVGGAAGFRRRLLELGFVPGTPVQLKSVAPMGDPLELEIRGCKMSLRRHEADLIVVEGPTHPASA